MSEELIQIIRTVQSILVTDGYGVEADRLHAVAARITELEAEVANAKKGWDSALRIANSSHEVAKQVAVERDAAIKEMHSRELHHFEEEQRADGYAAVIERAKALHMKLKRPRMEDCSCGSLAVCGMRTILATADTSAAVQALLADQIEKDARIVDEAGEAYHGTALQLLADRQHEDSSRYSNYAAAHKTAAAAIRSQQGGGAHE